MRTTAILLLAAFMWSCQEQGSVPVASDTGEGLTTLEKKGGIPGGPEDGSAETFDVTVTTAGGPVWTDGPQEVQTANAKGRLHIFDSGGNGTRGRPNYDNAAFSTKIFLQPLGACDAEATDPADMSTTLRDELFGKLDQTSDFRNVVFDFQVNYDIGDSEEAAQGFSIFLFRWEDGDRTFSASIGRFDADHPGPSIDFLGDNSPPFDDITNPDITRVFKISGGTVIARELNKNKVIATLACENKHDIEVTVAPHVVTP